MLATVYLVDDDDAVRRGLTRLISAAGYRVSAFASAREFIQSDRDPAPAQCLVLDVRLPGLSGLDLQRDLHAENATLPIIFVTGHGDVTMSVRAMKAGADDFLVKPVKDTDLLPAIERALARSRRAHALREELQAIRGRAALLTPREREVMAYIVAGRLNRQIADALGTVEKTIKVHRARVMAKMQARSLADLVRMAEKAQIPFPTEK